MVAVDLVRQHQQGLAGVDLKGIRLQRTGQRPGLHGQKFIAVVQMRGETEIVVTLAVEIPPPVRALGLVDQHCTHSFSTQNPNLCLLFYTLFLASARG